MSLTVDCTPLHQHEIDGVTVLVKREDLCCPYPGPAFSKLRGVVAHIQSRPEPVIGVLDTLHSKAGWAVSYVCQALGKQAVNYWPRYTADAPDALRMQQQEAAALGATLVALPAGRSSVLYHGAKRDLVQRHRGVYMMPNALKLPESVTENAAEAVRTAPDLPRSGTVVISISSGTVAAGVIRGLSAAGLLPGYHVVLHMGYSRSLPTVRAYVDGAAGLFFDDWMTRCTFIDEGYAYADANAVIVPFPCNPYYDAKAWAWLSRPGVARELAARGPIVFWNIGA